MVAILLPMMRCPNQKIRNKATEAIDRMFFNSILRFFEETYLVTTVCCFINLWYIMKTQQYSEHHSVLPYLALIIVFIYPLIILYLNLTDVAKLKSNKFKERAGVIYEDLNFRYGKSTLIWPLYLNLEKLILAYVLVFVFSYPFAQLFAVNFLSVAHLIILGTVEPYKDISTNRKELLDQVSVFLIFYHLFCATDFVSDAYTRSWVGWSMVMITAISLGANLLSLLYSNLKQLSWYLKKKNAEI